MPNKRTDIRNALKQSIESVYSDPVYVSQFVSPKANSYIQINFVEGAIEGPLLRRKTNAVLSITCGLKLDDDGDIANDADLDEIADIISPEISLENMPDFVTGLLPIGFEYSIDDDAAYSCLTLQFSISY